MEKNHLEERNQGFAEYLSHLGMTSAEFMGLNQTTQESFRQVFEKSNSDSRQ